MANTVKSCLPIAVRMQQRPLQVERERSYVCSVIHDATTLTFPFEGQQSKPVYWSENMLPSLSSEQQLERTIQFKTFDKQVDEWTQTIKQS